LQFSVYRTPVTVRLQYAMRSSNQQQKQHQ